MRVAGEDSGIYGSCRNTTYHRKGVDTTVGDFRDGLQYPNLVGASRPAARQHNCGFAWSGSIHRDVFSAHFGQYTATRSPNPFLLQRNQPMAHADPAPGFAILALQLG